MSVQQLHKRLLGTSASRMSRVFVTWVVLSLAVVLAPCCEAVDGLLPGVVAHAHAHDAGAAHRVCTAQPDHRQGLPAGIGLDHQSAWIAAAPAPVFPFAATISRTMRLGAPLAPARAPPYLRFGRLLI